MLSIDRLKLRLPPAYRQHANSIMERVGQLLAEADHHGLRNTDVLNVPAIKLHRGASSEDVALAIADGIKSTLRTEQ